jgi:hypothetical protein
MRLTPVAILAAVLTTSQSAAAQTATEPAPTVTPEALVGTWIMNKTVTVVAGADSSWLETRVTKDAKGKETKDTSSWRWRLSGDSIWWAGGTKSPATAQWWGNPYKVVLEPGGKKFSAYGPMPSGGWQKTPTHTFERSDAVPTDSVKVSTDSTKPYPIDTNETGCRGTAQAAACVSACG